MADDFLSGVMSKFKDKLVKDAEISLQEYVKQYKEKLDNVEKTNQKSMNETISGYHKKRKSLEDKFNQKLSSMITEAASKMDSRIANIDDELFNDRNKLYQKILNAAEDLKQKRAEFDKERQKWGEDDNRCAEWLGLSYDAGSAKKENKENDEEDTKALDDEEPANNNDANGKPKEKISDEDFITIKVDDKTFGTYRGTLTQVKDSFIAKLFGPHHHMIHRDDEGVYYLNCNPNTFGDVLEILRKRGSMTTDFKMTAKLYSALLEYGILEAFFPSFRLSELAMGIDPKKKVDYHVVFQSFRSTANNGHYLRWNVNHLRSEEKKENDIDYWKLNENDDSEIIFLKTGHYRVIFRCCIYYSAATYAAIYVNGSDIADSYHYNSTSNHYKSYNFNDAIQLNEGDKLKLYANTAANPEAKASYLCIERLPDAVLSSVGIWKSSSSSGYYRQWNTAVKTSDRYSLSNSNRNVNIQKGGLYRITARTHTYYTAAGARLMQLYQYRNANNHPFNSYQSVNSAGYECHMFDEIVSFKKTDYFQFYDGSYGTVSNANYDCLSIQHIPFAHTIGHWRTHSIKDSYIRVWDYEYWCNDMLYELSDDKTRIKVKEAGNYRVGAHLCNTQPSGQGYSAMYINDTEYCVSRMGCYNGSWYHTTSIQEIVQLKEGDKVHFYSSAPYSHYQHNSFFIEKLF